MLGLSTYKLGYGHRGINQPVKDATTGKVEVTSHNHGFAVGAPDSEVFETPFGPAAVTHRNLNDNVVEGLALLERPAFSVQYHPEAAAGPHDAGYLFERFVGLMLDRSRVEPSGLPAAPMHTGRFNGLGSPMHTGRFNGLGSPMHTGRFNGLGSPTHTGRFNDVGWVL